jgi:hypothetical protein
MGYRGLRPLSVLTIPQYGLYLGSIWGALSRFSEPAFIEINEGPAGETAGPLSFIPAAPKDFPGTGL